MSKTKQILAATVVFEPDCYNELLHCRVVPALQVR